MKKFFKFLGWLIIFALVLLLLAFLLLPLPGHVPVLMYHFIGSGDEAAGSKNYVSERSFASQMKFLNRFGYRIISLEELSQIRAGKRKPKGREIAITFDDGNYSYANVAHPILERYQFPTTVFFVSESVKRELHGSMSVAGIEKLVGQSHWFQIGSHTKSHPFLSQMKEEQIEEELVGSRRDLENLFGQTVDFIAYPYGDFDARVIQKAKEARYKLAFTTSYKKLNGIPRGPYAMTRTKITKSADYLFVFWVKASGIYDFFKEKRYQVKTALKGGSS